MWTLSEVDHALRRASEAGEVPGVVVAAANEDGMVYEAAFGKREIGKPEADDGGQRLLDRLDDEGDHLRRRDAARGSWASSSSMRRSEALAAACRAPRCS